MRQPERKGSYRPDYDDLMDGDVHLILCESPKAALRKAAALRTAARIRRMTPTARVLGDCVAFMASDTPTDTERIEA